MRATQRLGHLLRVRVLQAEIAAAELAEARGEIARLQDGIAHTLSFRAAAPTASEPGISQDLHESWLYGLSEVAIQDAHRTHLRRSLGVAAEKAATAETAERMTHMQQEQVKRVLTRIGEQHRVEAERAAQRSSDDQFLALRGWRPKHGPDHKDF